MKIQRALLTAASPSQRTLPLQSLVDRDGARRTALAIILEEVTAAGVEEVGIVICPGDQAAYQAAAGGHAARLRFIEQTSPLGYGHAVHCGREFIGNSPFLLLVADHLYVSSSERGCAAQLLHIAGTEECAVSAVQPTHESKLNRYGAAGGRLVAGRPGLYEIEDLIEKPTPTEAEQRLIVPGLRAGHYLCYFGMHVLTPAVMDILDERLREVSDPTHRQLTGALRVLADRERYLAAELQGQRFDIAEKYGLLTAQLALALQGSGREEVLSILLELLASQRSR